MKQLRKFMAMFLVMCMMIGCIPSSAFATEVVPETTVEETEVIESEISETEETELQETEAFNETEVIESETEVEESETETQVEETETETKIEETEETEEIEVLSEETKDAVQPTAPSDGTVSGSPFVKGTAGSNSYRIPAMVTLSDGTLVAAADARWNTTYDGGCGDTIVARSSDNGASWSYTFANYLGDNGNSYNGSSSTCFIDPALAVTSNDTIYMLVDLYPYGVALNGSGNTAPSTAVGFNSDGTLKLSKDGSNYNYYLKDGKIYSSSNVEESGYTVDGKFNVYSNGSYVSNLFFADSPYKVVRTGYLYLTKSTDGGASWSDPQLLNNIKTSSEQVCLVGPGRGTVLSDGTIVFPVYKYNGGTDTQRAGFIYSSDGLNWSRSDSNISWSSESAIVEINSSTLRVFYRNGNSKICYVDVTKNGNSYSWGSPVTTSVGCNSNTQLSAIKVTSAGNDYILVSNPGNVSNSSSGSARTNGQIVTFKAADMSVVKTTSVASVHTSNSFMYSCMSQLSNSNVAILYEDQESSWGTGSNSYYQMSFKTFTLEELGITTITGSDTITDEASATTVKTADGSYLTEITATQATVSGIDKAYVAYDVTLNGGKFTGSATVTIALNDELKAANSLTGFVVENGSVTQIAGNKSEDGNYYSFVTPHFSVVGVMSLDETEQAYNEEVKLTVGQTSSTYTVSSDTNYGSANTTTTDGIASYVQTGTDATSGTTYTVARATCNDIISSNKNNWTATNYYYTPDGTNYYVLYAKRSSSWKFIYTSYTYTWGYSTTSSNKNVTQIGTQETTSTGSTANITVYTKSGSGTATPASTTIQFTGVTSGTTYVTVGSTTYKVVVSPKESAETLSLKVGGTETLKTTVSNGGSVSYEVTSGSDKVTVAADGTVTPVAEGTATVVATVKASNGKAVEVITYTITIAERGGEEDVTVAVGEDKTISVTLKSGETVEWSSADAKTAAVVGDNTATATLLGTKAGTTIVTGTVKDSKGNVTATYKWNVTVTDSNTKSKYIYVNVSKIEHSTVYYAVNGGELIKVNGTGVLLDEAVTGHYQLAFFAAPDEGYALTYMASTNSAGEYYCLSDGEKDGVDGSAWPFADGYDWETKGISTTGSDSTVYNTKNGFRWGLAEGNITIAQLRNMYARAIALGCDGTLVFTKNNAGTTYDYSSNGNNLHSDLTFVSQPLPTLTKTIKTVGGQTYTAGTTKVKLGDEIVYTITVTRPATNASYGTITYSDEALYDKMTNGDASLMAAGTMGTSTTSDKIYSYETKITLNLENYDDIVKNGTITNTADFSFTYKSQYSNGKLSSSANASADQITIDAPSYVIDFGLPMTFEIDKAVIGDNLKEISATATYGDVEVTEGSSGKYSVTYTPNTVLQNVDAIKITADTTSYLVMVYPATTVYYEEGFADLTGTWSGSKGTASQTAAELGSDPNVYGYDAAYNASRDSGNYTAATSATSGDKASFTFTGTGVDIYANCDKTSGVLAIRVTDKDGATKYLGMVNTASINGTTSLTEYPAGDLYNVPITTVSGLAHGTYTVSIAKMGTAKVELDGFRVYNTLADSSVYAADLEDNPNFIEARDLNFGTINLADYDSKYASDLTKQIYEEVTQTDNVSAIIYSSEKAKVDASQDLIDNGPKNEIYLYPGMILSLVPNTPREVQIGLRGLQSSLTCKVGGDATTVSTTDMFYTVKARNYTGIYLIENPADSNTILAVTKIKVSDDPNPLSTVSEASIMETLLDLGYENDVTYADATLNINLVDYKGNVKATTSLTEEGIEGEKASFTSAAIMEAAQAVLPAGYDVAKDAFDTEVIYGEDGSVKVLVGKVATLKITYKKGKKVVGTATLTHVQTTSAKNYTFSTSEIKGAGPKGYSVISILGTSVNYGSTKSINATCK